MATGIRVTVGVLADRARRAAENGDLAERKRVLDQATFRTQTSQNQALDLDGMRMGSAALCWVATLLTFMFVSTLVLF